MTSFSGLTNAAAALAAQSYGMQITGQNIANADTEGYTRERVNDVSTGPAPGVPTLYATSPNAAGSVATAGVSRLNDPVIDAHARTQHAQSGYLDTAADTLSNIEGYFDEPSDTGLAETMSKFWSDWSAVANNPNDSAARSALLSQAQTVTDALNNTSNQLSQLATDTQTSLNSTVDQINTAAQSVAKLNSEIAESQASGLPTATLEDQRDLQLTKLATLGGGQAQFQTDGTVTVTMGGQTLVSGITANTVAVDATNNVTVGGTGVTLTGGQAQADVEALNTTIPNYQSQLDGVASQLASTVNSAHAAGYDLNGNPGGDFFSGTTAATITVAITDPKLVAASSTTGGTLDGGNAQQIGAIGASTTGADAAYRTLVANLGMDSSRATQQATVQDSITSNADAAQASVSGVSYDDEVTNLLTYQRAYQASSRVLTTVDQTLDTLINHTGVVGL